MTDSKKRPFDESTTDVVVVNSKRIRLEVKSAYRKHISELSTEVFRCIPVMPICTLIAEFHVQRDFTRCIECNRPNVWLFGGRCKPCGGEESKRQHERLWNSVTISSIQFDKIKTTFEYLDLDDNVIERSVARLIGSGQFMSRTQLQAIYDISQDVFPSWFTRHAVNPKYAGLVPRNDAGSGDLFFCFLIDRFTVADENTSATGVIARRFDYRYQVYRLWTTNELSAFVNMNYDERLRYLCYFHSQLEQQQISF